MWDQTAVGNDAAWGRSGPQRLATAGDIVWFYLGKLLWPHPLMTVYPSWKIDAGQPFAFVPLLLVVIAGMALWLSRRLVSARAGLLAFGCFLVALLPVSGVVEIGYFRLSFVADHLFYLASMAPLALAGAGVAFLHRSSLHVPMSLVGAGLLLVLGVASWQRTRAYQSQKTLWRDALDKDPHCWAAYDNLGRFAETGGQLDEAVREFQTALRLQPDDREAQMGLAKAQAHRAAETQ